MAGPPPWGNLEPPTRQPPGFGNPHYDYPPGGFSPPGEGRPQGYGYPAPKRRRVSLLVILVVLMLLVAASALVAMYLMNPQVASALSPIGSDAR
jgi:hypothetical protein